MSVWLHAYSVSLPYWLSWSDLTGRRWLGFALPALPFFDLRGFGGVLSIRLTISSNFFVVVILCP